MSHPSRARGVRAERELCGLLCDVSPWVVRRRLALGRIEDEGDLDGLPHCTAQVKDRSDLASAIRLGLEELAVQQAVTGDPYGVLFVRRRGARWVAVCSVPGFVALLADAAAYRQLALQAEP